MNEYTNTVQISDFEKHVIGTLRKMSNGKKWGTVAIEFSDGQCVHIADTVSHDPQELRHMNGNRKPR